MKALRTSSASGGRARECVTRRKVSDVVVPQRCTAGCRASRRAGGMGEPGGWWTAVLVSTTPASCCGCARAQPRLITPPQSWPTVTTGPSSPRAAVRSPRSLIRSARRRNVPVRSEKPISSWSTATTRHGCAGSEPAASRVRHRYDHVGLPCTHSSVPAGARPRRASWAPLSSRCQRRRVPGSSAAEVDATSMSRDHSGSTPVQSAVTKRFPPWRCSGRSRRPCTARGPRSRGSAPPPRGSWAGRPGPHCPSAGT